MPWISALRYAKAHLAPASGAEGQADAAAPLGARIGALLRYQRAPLIRARAAGSLFDMPAEEQDVVRAISHVRLDLSGSLWRLFTQVGNVLDDDDRFLQVLVDRQGGIVDALACSRLTGFIPSASDVALFRGDGGTGLGAQSYSLGADQLVSAGVPSDVLSAALGERDRLDFLRDVDSQAEFVAPFAGTEVRIDDADGTRGQNARVWFMPYVRNLADGSPEYLLIQMSAVDSRDGDPSRRAVLVGMWIAIPMEKERITIE